MIGNFEIYPFDKYLIVGAVTCPTYLDNKGKRINIADLKNAEGLSVRNFIPGMFMRNPTQKELLQVKSAVTGKIQVVTDEESKALNNYRNRFALIIERPIFLQFLTIILGVIALGSALYIGWIARFDAIPMQIAGYVVALWGIRNLLGESGSFPLLLDYAMLSMYLIIFSGIIFRKIAGNRNKRVRR
jgi:hypothetical protein